MRGLVGVLIRYSAFTALCCRFEPSLYYENPYTYKSILVYYLDDGLNSSISNNPYLLRNRGDVKGQFCGATLP